MKYYENPELTLSQKFEYMALRAEFLVDDYLSHDIKEWRHELSKIEDNALAGLQNIRYYIVKDGKCGQ